MFRVRNVIISLQELWRKWSLIHRELQINCYLGSEYCVTELRHFESSLQNHWPVFCPSNGETVGTQKLAAEIPLQAPLAYTRRSKIYLWNEAALSFLSTNLTVKYYYYSHFRDEKTQVKLFAQGHTGSRWERQDFNPGQHSSKAYNLSHYSKQMQPQITTKTEEIPR